MYSTDMYLYSINTYTKVPRWENAYKNAFWAKKSAFWGQHYLYNANLDYG